MAELPAPLTPSARAAIVYTMMRRRRQALLARQPRPVDRGEEAMALVISGVLRWGVVLSAAVVLSGAFIFLTRHGQSIPLYQVFKGEPRQLRNVGGIISTALSWRGRGLIQLGLLILLATPVARVVLSLAAFIALKDRTYAIVAAIVLAIVVFGLIGGPL